MPTLPPAQGNRMPPATIHPSTPAICTAPTPIAIANPQAATPACATDFSNQETTFPSVPAPANARTPFTNPLRPAPRSPHAPSLAAIGIAAFLPASCSGEVAAGTMIIVAAILFSKTFYSQITTTLQIELMEWGTLGWRGFVREILEMNHWPKERQNILFKRLREVEKSFRTGQLNRIFPRPSLKIALERKIAQLESKIKKNERAREPRLVEKVPIGPRGQRNYAFVRLATLTCTFTIHGWSVDQQFNVLMSIFNHCGYGIPPAIVQLPFLVRAMSDAEPEDSEGRYHFLMEVIERAKEAATREFQRLENDIKSQKDKAGFNLTSLLDEWKRRAVEKPGTGFILSS